MEVKDIIKNRRIELGLTLKQVASMCDVNEATVSRWESGDIQNMRRDNIMKLSSALKLSPSVIMEWNEPERTYYTDPDSRSIAEFLFSNPEYKVLFNATRKVKKEDIDFVKQFIDRMRGND